MAPDDLPDPDAMDAADPLRTVEAIQRFLTEE